MMNVGRFEWAAFKMAEKKEDFISFLSATQNWNKKKD